MIKVYFDDGMRFDRETGSDVVQSIHITKVLGTYLKQNVALTLSINGDLILNNGSSCLPCLQAEDYDTSPTGADLNSFLKDRYIINVQSHLQEGGYSLRRVEEQQQPSSRLE